MVKKIFAQTYLWVLLLLLYSPIVIIVIYSFTEAKVLGNWTGFSTKLYSSLFNTGAHHSLMNALVNTITIALLAATASTLLGSIAAIGIFNLKARSRKAIGFVNSIPILNGDIITVYRFSFYSYLSESRRDIPQWYWRTSLFVLLTSY